MKKTDLKVRSYSLYAIRKSNGKYYIGLTSWKDPMIRIKQHGGRKGAIVNRGFKNNELIEIRRIGKMPLSKALDLENDMTLEYRKKYGRLNVKGGRMVYPGLSLLNIYNPGSKEFYQQTLYLLVVITCIIIIYFVILAN